MAKVILRQEAIDDLSDIWDYTMQKWSENQNEIEIIRILHERMDLKNRLTE